MTKYLIGLIVVTALAIVGYATYSPSSGTALYQRTQWIGEYFAVGSSEQLTVDSSGNVVTTGTVTVNGLTETYVSESLSTATTTVCSLQSPTSASSTLLYAFARLDSSSTTASTVYLAKAATAFATTTSLGTAFVAANAQAVVVASTTFSGEPENPANVFAPGTWFNIAMAGGIGTFSPSGECGAKWATL